MGIYCPTPFTVELTAEFVEVVAKREPSKAGVLRRSIGKNFGSELMTGAIEWAQDMGVTSSMQNDASKVFAFDAVTQNPDRTADNPNLFVQGDLLAVIDHEASFSFLTTILKPSKGWSLGSGDFMERHALNYALRKGGVAWDVAWEAVESVDRVCFEEIRESIPQEWNADDDIQQIEQHVQLVLAHRIEFETELRGKIS